MEISIEKQNQRWNELSDESKEFFIKRYNLWDSKTDNGRPRRNEYEQIFGSHNINPQSIPKTWEDVERLRPETYGNEDIELFYFNEFAWDVDIMRKCKATLLISKLIDLGYGGMVSTEEKKSDVPYFAIFPVLGTKQLQIADNHSTNIYSKDFVSFHTRQQAEEFLSYESNRRLVELYYMT